MTKTAILLLILLMAIAFASIYANANAKEPNLAREYNMPPSIDMYEIIPPSNSSLRCLVITGGDSMRVTMECYEYNRRVRKAWQKWMKKREKTN